MRPALTNLALRSQQGTVEPHVLRLTCEQSQIVDGIDQRPEGAVVNDLVRKERATKVLFHDHTGSQLSAIVSGHVIPALLWGINNPSLIDGDLARTGGSAASCHLCDKAVFGEVITDRSSRYAHFATNKLTGLPQLNVFAHKERSGDLHTSILPTDDAGWKGVVVA